MLVKDFIEKLEKNIEFYEANIRYIDGEDMLGPLEIRMDIFDKGKYTGIGDLYMYYDTTGLGLILSAFDSDDRYSSSNLLSENNPQFGSKCQ